jgi:hypothetical protein
MRFEITLFAIRNGHRIGTNQFDNSRDHNKPSHVGRNQRRGQPQVSPRVIPNVSWNFLGRLLFAFGN